MPHRTPPDPPIVWTQCPECRRPAPLLSNGTIGYHLRSERFTGRGKRLVCGGYGRRAGAGTGRREGEDA